MTGRVDFDELAQRLGQRVDQLVPVLLPAAKRDPTGQFWRVGSFAGEEGGSLSINRRGRRLGMWCEFSSGKGERFHAGNMLQLINEVRFGGNNIRAAAEWAVAWLGDSLNEPAPERKPAAPEPKRRDDRALNLWLAAKRLVPGDPVHRYLAGRGVDLSQLPRPAALRYHPDLWHSPTQRCWPAMVALVSDAEGNSAAVHRTWLDIIEHWEPEEGFPSDVRKAPVPEPKMSWGPIKGGCIRLSNGKSGLPWERMPPGQTLLIGEGIEDTLSGMQRYPDWAAAAGVSLGAMQALELPPQIGTVAILRQRDKPGSAAAISIERVIDRLLRQGRRVLEWQVPVFVKDINELDQKLHAMGVEHERAEA